MADYPDNIEVCCANCEHWTPPWDLKPYRGLKGRCNLQSSDLETFAIYGKGVEVFTPDGCHCAEFEPCEAALDVARLELEEAKAIWETNQAMLREDGLLFFGPTRYRE